MIFSTHHADIENKIKDIDPIAYGLNRNYLQGNVTKLSPYISRGVISTRQVLDSVLSAGYPPIQIEKFIQELAWRDYWQQEWIAFQSNINQNLKNPASSKERMGMPAAIVSHQTNIEVIDQQIAEFHQTGYLHNHLRMYIASITCNIAHCHWLTAARWMYYHLLDGDWASNALSWQWVSGANSHKKYYANQENINRFCHSTQGNTFLDVSYDAFPLANIPNVLQELITPEFTTPLPDTIAPTIDPKKPTLIYNYYNLDPLWHKNEAVNRILLLEPSVFAQYPISKNSVDFAMQLAIENIAGIQIWVAEFETLKQVTQGPIYFKEHPLNQYQGIEEPREWLSNVKGHYPSFFAFWKKCKKEIFA